MNANRPQSWKWLVCAMLLFATMLNYMDRQTLSLTILRMDKEINLTDAQYSRMEWGFGMAFAFGGLLTGFIVDRMSVRWLYPAVLVGWSLAGIATAVYPLEIGSFVIYLTHQLLAIFHSLDWLSNSLIYVTERICPRGAEQSDAEYTTTAGLLTCRIVLGMFEAGHWPCALVVTQRILSSRERSFGNSLLQSGAAFGAILTPIITWMLVRDQIGGWKPPFVVIGALGMSWVVPWLLLIRRGDLANPNRSADASKASALQEELPERTGSEFWRRFGTLIIVVVAINMSWQFFRAWLPKFLVNQHHYDEKTFVFAFTMFYFIAADIGCIAVGYMTKHLATHGVPIHRARMLTFTICALFAGSALLIADMRRGPLLLGLILIFGFGCLGLFPNFYSFSQELSGRNQGKVTGFLGATTWIVTSIMQWYVGDYIEATKSYRIGMLIAGAAPLVALAALLLFWPRTLAQQTKKPTHVNETAPT